MTTTATYTYIECKGQDSVTYAKQFTTYSEAKTYFDHMIENEPGMHLRGNEDFPDRFRAETGILFEIATIY
jgi:hypothetical protein